MAIDIHSNIMKARTCAEGSSCDHTVPYSNIGDLISARVRDQGDDEWLIYCSDDDPRRRSFTYRRFSDDVRGAATFLLDHGISRGDRVATISFNHSDTVIQYFAAFMIGAVVVPINLGEDDRRIGFILKNSGCKLAFVRDQFIGRVAKILGDEPSVGTVVGVGSRLSPRGKSLPANYVEFEQSTPGLKGIEIARQHVGLDDEALIVYTSGTTGLPKGVVLTQYNLLVDAKAISEWHGLEKGQRMMCVLPIHHVNGTVVTLMTPLYYGGSVVLNQKFHTATFFQRLADERVHVVSVVPTLLQFLLHERLSLSRYDLSCFRHLICGAGPLTVELALNFEKTYNLPIIHGYGLSETTCYSCFLPLDLSPEEHTRWLGSYGFPSIGVPVPPNEMAIHDGSGNELGEEARGEIVIRGHNVMKEYYANPEENLKTFAHGWFRSGDEGFYKRDERGRKFFFITGRIKELIIRGGTNISPFEIDEVLMNMPGIKAGLAVGFENDWYGEEVGAYVQAREGIAVTEGDVIDYCRKFFPFPKCPKVVVFGDDIPVTSTGKYQRNKLKPLFAQWKGEQFTEKPRTG